MKELKLKNKIIYGLILMVILFSIVVIANITVPFSEVKRVLIPEIAPGIAGDSNAKLTRLEASKALVFLLDPDPPVDTNGNVVLSGDIEQIYNKVKGIGGTTGGCNTNAIITNLQQVPPKLREAFDMLKACVEAGNIGGEPTFRIAPSKIVTYVPVARGQTTSESVTTYALYDPDGPTGPQPERALPVSVVTWSSDDMVHLKKDGYGTSRSGRGWIGNFQITPQDFSDVRMVSTTITATFQGKTFTIPVTIMPGVRPGRDINTQLRLNIAGGLRTSLPFIPRSQVGSTVSDAHYEMTVGVGETKPFPLSIATGEGENTEDVTNVENLMSGIEFQCNWMSLGGDISCNGGTAKITGLVPGQTVIYHDNLVESPTSPALLTKVTVH